jgi:acylphosphatase
MWVSGRVQGVGFRFFVQRRARELGLTGFVRNLPDRRLEVAAEGPPADVQALVETVRAGPSGARVYAVEVTWEEPDGAVRFEIRGNGDA